MGFGPVLPFPPRSRSGGYLCHRSFVLLAATFVHTLNWALIFFVLVSFTVNSTHSLLGPAAAMDIGGRKAAAFASGCIDAFQYFGAALAIKGLGYALDKWGWIAIFTT